MNDGVDIEGSWRGCEWGGLCVKKREVRTCISPIGGREDLEETGGTGEEALYKAFEGAGHTKRAHSQFAARKLGRKGPGFGAFGGRMTHCVKEERE